MIHSDAASSQIMVLIDQLIKLEAAGYIEKNMPLLVIVEVTSSLQYTADDRLCARELALILTKKGRIILLASPDRLSRQWSEMHEFLHHCSQEEVPVFSHLPYRLSESDPLEIMPCQLDALDDVCMFHLEEYLTSEYVVVQSARSNNQANRASARGSAHDLLNMLQSRGVFDPSKVIGVARTSSKPNTESRAILARQKEEIQALLPTGSQCHAFHQSISMITKQSELAWTAHVDADGTGVVVCKRLDRLVRNLEALHDLAQRFPELWIVVEKLANDAPEPLANEPFLVFQLKDVAFNNNDPSTPLQQWIKDEMVFSAGFVKSMTEGSRALLNKLHSLARSNFPGVECPTLNLFPTCAEMFNMVSATMSACLASLNEPQSTRALFANFGPHFLLTDIKWNSAHQRTDVRDVPKIEAVQPWVSNRQQAAQMRKVHDGSIKSVAQVCSTQPGLKMVYELSSAFVDASAVAALEEMEEELLDEMEVQEEEEEDVEDDVSHADNVVKQKSISAKLRMLHFLNCMACGAPPSPTRKTGFFGATCGPECALAIALSIGCIYPVCACGMLLPFVRARKGVALCQRCLAKPYEGRTTAGHEAYGSGAVRFEDSMDIDELAFAVCPDNLQAVLDNPYAKRVFSEILIREASPKYFVFAKSWLRNARAHIDVDHELAVLCETLPQLLTKVDLRRKVWFVAHFPGFLGDDAASFAFAAVQDSEQRETRARSQGQKHGGVVKGARRKAATDAKLMLEFPTIRNWEEIKARPWIYEVVLAAYCMQNAQGYMRSDDTRRAVNLAKEHNPSEKWCRRRVLDEAARMVPQYFAVVEANIAGVTGQEALVLRYSRVVELPKDEKKKNM
jgi:DNA invertase Pin-like site-specific DNA recombinase